MNKVDLDLSLCLRSSVKERFKYNVDNVFCLFVCFQIQTYLHPWCFLLCVRQISRLGSGPKRWRFWWRAGHQSPVNESDPLGEDSNERYGRFLLSFPPLPSANPWLCCCLPSAFDCSEFSLHRAAASVWVKRTDGRWNKLSSSPQEFSTIPFDTSMTMNDDVLIWCYGLLIYFYGKALFWSRMFKFIKCLINGCSLYTEM